MQTDQKLPAVFLEAMERLLGDDYQEFLNSYDQPRRNGLRVNRLRVAPEDFLRIAPFRVEPVPWADNGFYVDYRDMPARHPWYNAGVYYLQEPSAMAPAQILPAEPGDRVLDLCAAPGGKATELGAKLAGEGLLVANEISPSRVKALLRNIEQSGISNTLVTNETPAHLAERFPEFFDKVLVDAPCSGEGMFRKDPDVVRAWYPEKAAECAAVQREIILQAADMLRPGGCMVYSTCTFAPEENELVLLHLLKNRPQMELVQIPRTEGRESFSPAFSIEKLRECGYDTGEESFGTDLTRAVRIWPHKAGGEGHFTALLQKRSEGSQFADRKIGTLADRSSGLISEKTADRSSGRKASAGKGKKAAKGGRETGMTREDLGYLTEFLRRFLPQTQIAADRLENHGGKLYLSPDGLPDVRGLTFLRNGLYLGDLKKNRFEPAQELAMALPSGTQGEERISFTASDERTAQYLRGEPVRIEEDRENGWYLVCVDGYPLGWGKLTKGLLKNKLLAGWRN